LNKIIEQESLIIEQSFKCTPQLRNAGEVVDFERVLHLFDGSIGFEIGCFKLLELVVEWLVDDATPRIVRNVMCHFVWSNDARSNPAPGLVLEESEAVVRAFGNLKEIPLLPDFALEISETHAAGLNLLESGRTNHGGAGSKRDCRQPTPVLARVHKRRGTPGGCMPQLGAQLENLVGSTEFLACQNSVVCAQRMAKGFVSVG